MRSILWLLVSLLAACKQEGRQADQEDEKIIDSRSKAPKSFNGPFGIAIGTPLADLDLGKSLGDDPFERPVKAPRPHPSIESYSIYGTDETGVCKIFGISKTNENDGSGVAVRTAIDSFAAALEVKYGEPVTSDLCGAGEIACQAQFWMMTLSQGNRVYAKQWTKQNDAMKKARIKSIDLLARGLDIQSSDFLVGFTGDNEAQCNKASTRASAENL